MSLRWIVAFAGELALKAEGVWAPALEGALLAIRRTGLVTEEQLQARLSVGG
jgi:hypothetical protein